MSAKSLAAATCWPIIELCCIQNSDSVRLSSSAISSPHEDPESPQTKEHREDDDDHHPRHGRRHEVTRIGGLRHGLDVFRVALRLRWLREPEGFLMAFMVEGDPFIFLDETEVGKHGAKGAALVLCGIDVVSPASDCEPAAPHLESPAIQQGYFPRSQHTVQTSHIDSVHGFAAVFCFCFAAFAWPIAPLMSRIIDQRRSMEPMTIMEVVIIGRPMDRKNIPPRMSYIQGGKWFIQSPRPMAMNTRTTAAMITKRNQPSPAGPRGPGEPGGPSAPFAPFAPAAPLQM